MKVLAIILLCFVLQGCATLTIAGIGTAVAIGVATGVGQYTGRTIARHQWRRHAAYKRCRHLRHDQQRLVNCIQRYIDVTRMVREDERRWRTMSTR